MTGATKKTAGFYFHCGPYTKYNWIFWFFKKSCWEKIVKVIIIIMIIEAIIIIIVKTQNICNLSGWKSVRISDIFHCYSANINRMWNARNVGGN